VTEGGAVQTTVVGQVASGPSARRADIVPIVIQPALMDLGFIRPGTTARGEVELFNVSDEPVKILKSATTCLCTTVDLSETVIPPRSLIKLPAALEAGQQLGPKSATITLIFEGYDAPLEVSVKAEVALAVRSIPGFISHQVPHTREYADRFEYQLESIDGAPFRVVAVQGDAPDFVGFDPAVDAPRAAYTLVFDFSRYSATTCLDAQGRPMPPYLAIETDHPGGRLIDMRIMHACTRHEMPEPGQDWTLAERRALIGVVEPGGSAEFTVPLRWRPDSPREDRIVDVVSESRELSAELLEEFEDEGTLWYRVRVTVAADHRGLLYGRVRMRSARNDMAMHVIGLVEGPGSAADPAGPPNR
jgi:hypothetical protein